MVRAKDLPTLLRAVKTDVLKQAERATSARMLSTDVRARLDAVNRADVETWSRIRSRADWEALTAERVEALRRSLGTYPDPPVDLKVRVTRTLEGSGFRVENLLFESRPGVVVTANLYVPEPERFGMPGILFCHSHHRPKTQAELQDMGMNWARQGALVLVMDQLGHGERAQQPFGGREDYHFRYLLGMQLHLIGDGLMGWMVWDLMRGVDLLLAREGVDREKIILIGAVAGGGDPAAVAAALDRRIACAVPFNFGGPQPETEYPLPADAATSFDYVMSGGWESTRNLRLSGRDGFLPWVIVGSIAPRHLIYAHEFSWDRERDPVWVRFRQLWEFYGAGDRLAFTHGAGLLSGRPPEATHCTNVGPEHRRLIYQALKRWFQMPVPEPEYQKRFEAADLLCLTPTSAAAVRPRPVHELARELGDERGAPVRATLSHLGPRERREALRDAWANLLGDVAPRGEPEAAARPMRRAGGLAIERVLLRVEPGIVVPLVLLRPPGTAPAPIVVGLAQEGKTRFLTERAAEIAGLLERGVAVCLPDLRGTGETRPDDARGRESDATAISSSELMLGQTLLGARLRDLRSVLAFLRRRRPLDAARVALWGDSFAPTNPLDLVDPPLAAPEQPVLAEPLGALLALFGALFEEDVKAAVARRGLVGFASILDAPFCHVPHDVIVPGALEAGDLDDVLAALAPLPVRVEAPVDGRNRAVPEGGLAKWFAAARQTYAAHAGRLSIAAAPSPDLAGWLATALGA